MGDNDSNDKKNANRHSLNAIKGGFVKDMVNRGFRKKINDSDKNDDSKEDKGGEKPSNVSKDSSSMKAGNVAALRDQFKRAAEKDESKDQNSQAGQSSLTSKAPLGDPRTDQRARAKFLAEKYEKILAARNMVEESASRALQRPATSTPAKIPASVSGVSKEPKDTSEQPRPSKAEPRPSTTPSTSLGPQEPKDTSEQPRPSKAEPRPSTTPSTSLGPQEPKDTSEQPRPSKAEPRPSTTPSTSLGPQEPKDTSEQPRSSKAESKLSTTLSKLRFSRESRSVIKGTGSFGGSSQVSSNAGRRVHTLADTASTDDASIRQAMSQSFSSPGVSQPEQPERASRGRNMFGMRRRPCWIRIQVKEKIFPGKMILAISTTILIIVVFMFELFINRATFNGRCIGEVDYTHRHEGKAILSYLGYVGCENNLKTTAAERGFLGAGASDKGYPVDYVHKGNLATSLAPPDGPNYRIGTIVGALSANTIRIYGESSRLLTSIFLHGGRWHLLCNCLMNMLLLYVIEPDWGFKRTLALYIFGGYSANLVHASMSPCIPCWGASGSLFSLYGAFIPYTVEHWDNLRSPMALIVIAITISLLEIILPGVGVSNHAHLGGFAFGLCFGFATLKSVSAFDRGALWSRIALRFSSRLSPEAVQKHQAKVVKSAQSEEILRIKYEQGAKDSANRLRFVKRMFGIYPYGPYRMRLRDVLTRVVFLCALIAMFVFFYLATFYESVYKNIDRNATILFSRACHCGYFKSSGDELLLNQIGNLAGKFYCFDSESARDKFCAVSG
ncbi:Rhomboid family protein [Babesia bovis T2Bo]|uniref:Rhomboid-like protease n=1 Tax=Babesia bovis TaxID=5865 RepID=A7AUD2_BABBO|nr:Rhomboid family protein [Babesia bovis T2Bo]EDO06543.1 Rhomboid family protein [Babesia bovis T2Bo]|eukprot:XP_001610111.1 rhomboid 4 [Babesia bovis T2Bo]